MSNIQTRVLAVTCFGLLACADAEAPLAPTPASDGTHLTSPPEWPPDATLTVSEVQGHSAMVHWPGATDDHAVVSYTVLLDGLERAVTSGGASSVLLTSLPSASEFVAEVFALDGDGARSEVLSLTFVTLDVTTPAWPESATLQVLTVAETEALLSWSAATDDVAVESYEIWHQDSPLSAIFDGTTASLSGLSPWTEYDLYVVAIDEAGNRSLPGPLRTFSTTDDTPPSWSASAAMFADKVTSSSVTLSWPEATDEVGVSTYDVLLDGVVSTTTLGAVTSATMAGLPPGAELTFSVRASDPAGNLSTTGPSVTLKTDDNEAPTWPTSASILVSNLTPTSATLAWSAATDNVAVSSYRVVLNGAELSQVPAAMVELSGLTPWADYLVEVWAHDGVQNATASSLTMSFKTPDTSAPAWAPESGLEVMDLHPNGLTLIWPQATDDVAVKSYRVYQDDALIAEPSGTVTTIEIGGLSPWTSYQYRVQAQDPAGNTTAMDLTLEVQTPDTSAPTWPNGSILATEVGPSEVTVAWTPAEDDSGVTQYRVTVNEEEHSLVDGDTTSLQLSALSPWTDYAIGVEARDAAGNWSSNGPEFAVKTLDDSAPQWPDDAEVVVEVLESTSLKVSWPAASDDVAIVGYVIALDGVDFTTVEAGESTATLAPLAPVTTYLISVAAKDPAGNTSESLEVTAMTPDGGPPTWPSANLSASSVTQESVHLTWTEAVDDVGVVAYRAYNGDALMAELSATELEVEGLAPDTAYSFRVEAGDAAGNWSSSGPTVSVSTTDLYDPGFRRLSTEQFQRALSSVASTLWSEGCENYRDYVLKDPGAECPGGFTAYETTEEVHFRLTELHYGIYQQYRDTYPVDARVGASDEVYGGHWRLDQAVHDEHVTSWTLAVMTMANDWFGKKQYGAWMRGFRLVHESCKYANDDGITNFSTTEEMHENCAEDFIARLGRRAFRRPLTEDEIASFMEIYYEVPALYPAEQEAPWLGLDVALRNIMATILLSPEFLYQVELGDNNGNLSAYELASRLSFHLWNTSPDDELLAAAESGSLLTEEGYQAQVDRLYDDPRAERSIEEFYSAYFRVDDLHDIDAQDGPYLAEFYLSGPNFEEGVHPNQAPVAGGYNKQNNTRPMYNQAARAELLNLGEWFTRTEPGTFEEMFRSNLHFLECQEGSLAGQCYGAGAYSLFSYGVLGSCVDMQDCAEKAFIDTGNGWDGVSEPITLPEPERAGLITRIAFLGHDTLNARPIQRGLKIRDMLLCEPIPPPEDCDVVKPPNLTGHCELDGATTGQSCSHDIQCGDGEVCVDPDKEVTMTVREKVEELTETPGTTCAGCHSTFINGFGHALSHFSSVGQYWELEHMFSDVRHPQTGAFLFETHTPEHWKPIDASATFFFDGDQVTVDGAHEAADLLVASGKLESCWSREYFRFAMGRVERDEDLEAIEGFADLLRGGASLAEAYVSVVHLPQFKTLKKVPLGPAEQEETP